MNCPQCSCNLIDVGQTKMCQGCGQLWIEENGKIHLLKGAEDSGIDCLREYRKQQGISQETVARRMGTKRSSVCRFESGKNNPTLSFIDRYASAIGVKMSIRFQPLDSIEKAYESSLHCIRCNEIHQGPSVYCDKCSESIVQDLLSDKCFYGDVGG